MMMPRRGEVTSTATSSYGLATWPTTSPTLTPSPMRFVVRNTPPSGERSQLEALINTGVRRSDAGRLGTLSQLQHAHLQHHAGDAVDAGANGELVEAQPLAAFVAEHVDAGFARGLAQRARALGAFQHDIGAESAAELLHARALAEHAADLRQIDAMDGGGMQVDADLRSLDDLGEE